MSRLATVTRPPVDGPLLTTQGKVSPKQAVDLDITHAYQHALVRLDYDADEHPPRFALVGPDTAGNFIELVAFLADDDRIIVIHAMKARPHFLALLQDPENPT